MILLKPKFFIPIHGEYRHLKRHAQLVEDLGTSPNNILIAEIGNCVELTENSISLGENISAGARLIDGEGFEDYGTSEVMKDRLKMSTEGIFIVSLAVTGSYVINEPVIEIRGFVFAENNEITSELKTVVQNAVKQYDYEKGNKDELVACIQKSVKNYLYRKTKQSPLIIVSVLDV